MVEKLITLEGVSLIDFLGVENENIKKISKAFPNSKITSRGNEIKMEGPTAELMKLSHVVESLVDHYNEKGKLTPENVDLYLSSKEEDPLLHDEKVIVYANQGHAIKPNSKNQKDLVDAVGSNDLVFVIGPAGTGKTFISVALAVKALKNKEIRRIIITRPAVEAGEHLGFLPGDLEEKIDPYLRPIFDSLNQLLPSEKLTYYKENGIIEVAPLAYMRGRTLNDAFVLLDEAQNTTTQQMKMFLTRMGANSKMIISGDISQIDLPKVQKSGMKEALDLLKGVEGISIIKMDVKDIVRHKLVGRIVEKYDKASKEKESKDTK